MINDQHCNTFCFSLLCVLTITLYHICRVGSCPLPLSLSFVHDFPLHNTLFLPAALLPARVAVNITSSGIVPWYLSLLFLCPSLFFFVLQFVSCTILLQSYSASVSLSLPL